MTPDARNQMPGESSSGGGGKAPTVLKPLPGLLVVAGAAMLV
jgi:hypothetical protein